MSIEKRIEKLEAMKGEHHSLKDLTDEELNERFSGMSAQDLVDEELLEIIRRGCKKEGIITEPITDEELLKIIEEESLSKKAEGEQKTDDGLKGG